MAVASRVVRLGATGAALGICYGIALRAWMRFGAEDPEFTWTGTGFIVGAFAVLGLMAGLVTAAKELGWTRRTFAMRVVGIILSLACFAAAGILMLPTIVPAALGVGRVDWWRPVRGLLILVGAGAAVPIILTVPEFDPDRRVFALLIYLALCPLEVLMVARLYAPSLRRGTVLRWRREPVASVRSSSSPSLRPLVE